MSQVPSLTQIVSGDADDPSKDMANWNAIRNVVNGSLDTTNLSASAAITAAQTVFGSYTAPTTWVPTVHNNADSSTIGGTVNQARYWQIGKQVTIKFNISAIANPGGSGLYILLPVAAATTAIDITSGFTYIFHTGLTNNGGYGTIVSGKETKMYLKTDLGAALATDSSIAVTGTLVYEVS